MSERRGQRTEGGGRVKTEVRGQKGKQRHRARKMEGSVAEDLFERGLCLPSGTAITNSDLDRIIETILRCRKP